MERFGRWPSFHDSEIYALRLDSGQRSDGTPRLQMDIHVFAVGGVNPNGMFEINNHTMVTLEFTDVRATDLKWFDRQNVLMDLKIDEAEEISEEPDLPKIGVELPSSVGLDGSFRCSSVSVIEVSDFSPGEHSVYRR